MQQDETYQKRQNGQNHRKGTNSRTNNKEVMNYKYKKIMRLERQVKKFWGQKYIRK